jgi:hypothetical protein
MCLDREFHGDVIPYIDGYKDFIVGVRHGIYVLRPTYQCNAMVYDNVNPWYTVPNGLAKIPTWYSDAKYPAGFHAYASPTAPMSSLNIRCAVRLHQVRTLGVQNDEVVIVADQFRFKDNIARHVHEDPSKLYVYGTEFNHVFDPAKFESDMQLVLRRLIQ